MQYLIRRRAFLRSNPQFMSEGSISRLTSKHLYLQEHLPSRAQDELNPDTNRLEVGNRMWEQVKDVEAPIYAQRVKDHNLEQLKGNVVKES